jgi:hypothetical protein
LGVVDYDATVESSIGKPEDLKKTSFYRQVAKLGMKL